MDSIVGSPLVSVIMSVYNGSPLLRPAIDSILGQTFTNFEFIIIDDGSTDETPKILKSYTDSRLSVMTQKNKGLVASLNTGIKAAKGTYIARMDADDISLPTRLSKQVAHMIADESCVLLGSNLTFIDMNGDKVLDSPLLTNDGDIKLEMLIRSPFGHGSVMYPREVVKSLGGYNAGAWPAEDYELWRCLMSEGRFANINEVLYLYRMNQDGISSQNQQLQQDKAAAVRARIWADLDTSNAPALSTLLGRYGQKQATQKARLREVYMEVALMAWGKQYRRLAGQMISQLLTSPRNIVRLARFAIRKTLRSRNDISA